MSATRESNYFGEAVREWTARKERAIFLGNHQMVYIADRFLAFYSVGIRPLDVPDDMFFGLKWGERRMF